MASRTFLELPAEIRNNIYRHVLCYDGIKPEVKTASTPWPPRVNSYPRPSNNPFRTTEDSCGTRKIEESSSRMQLDVITPVRRGFYSGVQSSVSAREVLALLCACRQTYEEAYSIFPDQDAMHNFLHRIGPKPFALIQTLGIETTANAEWISLPDGDIDLGYWFADARIPPLLPPPHLYGWEISFEDYTGVRDAWIADYSDPLRFRKIRIGCQTTYNWLTWPRTGVVEPIKSSRSYGFHG